jgi:hypothetical protein
LPDLESDFSAIHHIRDPYGELTGPQYFQMAIRMGAYRGVMRAHLEAEAEKQRPKSPEEMRELRKAGALSPGEEKALRYGSMLGNGSRKR